MFFGHISGTLSLAPKGLYCYRALRRISWSVMIDWLICALEGTESSPWVKEWLCYDKAGVNIVI